MVRRVVNLFYKEIRGLHQAAYILAVFALASQLLAILRDRLLAHSFGASKELDIYYAAFKIPDVLFVVFSSLLSVYVLIPFVARAQNKGMETARNLLTSVFSFFLIAYSMLAIPLFIFAPNILSLLFPSLMDTSSVLLVTLVRILMLQPLFLGISSLFGVITQIQKRFVIFAVSPILYNLGIIIGIIHFYPSFGLAGLGWGVVLGALLHLAVQLPLFVKSDLRFSFSRPSFSSIIPVIKTAIPRAITLSLNQMILLVLTVIAATMTVGSVTVFQFGFNLQSVPLTIIGVSYSVAAFPVLANFLAKSEFNKFRTHIQTAFRHIIFWAIPITVIVILLRAHIVRLTLGSGNFSWDDTRLTAAVLALFVVALVAQSINLLTIRAFYANSDTKTPFFITLLGGIVTVWVAYFGYNYFLNEVWLRTVMETLLRLQNVPGSEVIMLPFAFAVGVTIQAILLLILFSFNFPKVLKPLWRTASQAIIASVLGGLTIWLVLRFLVEGINQNTFIGILLQGSVAGIFGCITICITYAILDSKELREIHTALKKKFIKQPILGRPHSDTL